MTNRKALYAIIDDMKKVFILALTVIMLSTFAYAAEVKNVRTQLAGNRILSEYDLLGYDAWHPLLLKSNVIPIYNINTISK
jgi:hypothetical protein